METDLGYLIRDRSCKRCELWRSAQTVNLVGEGPYPCDYMLVGEAPGKREDYINRPFSGKSGQEVLDPALQDLGVSRSSLYVSNCVHCRPPDNRTPTNEEIRACSFWLEKELEYVRPKKVLALGLPALKALMNKYNVKQSTFIGKKVKLTRSWGEFEMLVTYHPAKILRQPFLLDYFYIHLENFFFEKERVDTVSMPWNESSFKKDFKKFVTFDIETEGFDPRKGELISIAVSPKSYIGYWIDIAKKEKLMIKLNKDKRSSVKEEIKMRLNFDGPRK